jgi:hypothetical protein
VPVNDLSLSIRNPIFIYSFLALYGLMTVLILAYVHAKFRIAARTLKALQAEWANAESAHASVVESARKQLSKLVEKEDEPQRHRETPSALRSAAGSDVRNQVVTMAKRGIVIADIARNCGLHEGEVEVLLGAARLTKGSKNGNG